MNLIEIRKKFKELSGRYDLVNEDNSDNGATFLANEACKWLDKTVETSKTGASYMQLLTAGDWYVEFPNARAIKEVWVTTADGRWQLQKKRLQDLIASYYADIPADRVNGTPYYYSPAISRYIPEDITPATLLTFANYVGTLDITGYTYDALIISTPIDVSGLIEVLGFFYSAELSEDKDENYWTTVHPLLLVEAMTRMSHIITGNKPMLDILDRGLDGDLQRLEKDRVEQEIAEVDQMEG